MTAPSDAAPSEAPATAAATLACLHLLQALQSQGLTRLVLCPGSRSAPLAVAASLQEARGLKLFTAIDERSAAFFALGMARGEGTPVAVVTTSGSAVANLLPALVEADQGTIPLVLLTADRPARLKGCGANQTVNQEAFLQPCCRWIGQGAPQGLASMGVDALQGLALQAMAAATGRANSPAGPVHLNLPLEEPLHPDEEALAWLRTFPAPSPALGDLNGTGRNPEQAAGQIGGGWERVLLDPNRPGVVVAGPWRGTPSAWAAHLEALHAWHKRSGWPVLADALSGLRGVSRAPMVVGYDLLLEDQPEPLNAPQVLRLGPLPASRRLQAWLQHQSGPQVLVSEGDPRPLDPLRSVLGQWSGGLASWPGLAMAGEGEPSPEARTLCRQWLRADRLLQESLQKHGLASEECTGMEALEEPNLARELGRLLPPGLAVMLANSSPVRDWESFADPTAPGRPVFSFRGASGIDGTLSIACGLAEVVGQLVLVSGDLALQHDSNGWLLRSQLQGRLLVVLIDNGGGGIFEQLPIRPSDSGALDVDRLFAMPQEVDPCGLAAAHGVPSRQVLRHGELKDALTWGLAQPMALLRLVCDRKADAARRRQLRTMAAELMASP